VLALAASLTGSPFDDNVFPFEIAEVAQTLPECLVAGRVRGKLRVSQVSYAWNFSRLLRRDKTDRNYSNEGNDQKRAVLHSDLSKTAVALSRLLLDIGSYQKLL
jgi:hypothetical protein